jgi:hypothetical protein
VALRNRVTPLSELVADPSRASRVFGNRGCLHDADRRVVRHHDGRRWIACRLEFKGRHRGELMRPGRYTELFFLDEATALAAGHRPCAECRRADYDALLRLWRELHPGDAVSAAAVDARLHAERLEAGGRAQRRHDAEVAELPDGAFVLREGRPWLVHGDALRRWTPAGYAERAARPARGPATVITPPSLVALLRTDRAPLVPLLHPSASDTRDPSRPPPA